ncbi:hypothetical protein QQ054_15005 [Oscillatoria amoena NRMC-F 0135]|nr:hypothetical protein [Oscillatoria amoena NRMC-F 0135]
MSKREAVYASAVLQSTELAVYDPDTSTLSTPVEAPLPEAMTRIACLSAGEPARIEQRRLLYTGIPPSVGTALLVAAGQSYPSTKTVVFPWRLGRG